ncbi:hypothetical protein D6D01_10158 [Aureobasidium pullulans]|uniref:F-box domain-containing protein n=1 Tax=Aureobasidium pullulans TaxID=5580 RepID=A0A4S9JP03_AURPU|nr:hypothetical protein D6D01_10158 [Aureobasidium pullulans]
MSAFTKLPDELILLLFESQNTMSDLLALSAINKNLRSIFMDNKSTIRVMQVICKNNDLSSATKAVVDVIHEVDNIYPRSCDCAEKDDDHHFHKDLANQQHSADAQANLPTALRYIRGLSRAVNAAMTFTVAAITFWVSVAEVCTADHETALPNKIQIAQTYLLIWTCAESHFSFCHEDRVNKMMLELSTPILAFTAKVYRFMTFDMSRDIQLSLGIADPDRDDDDFDHESIELDSYFVQWEWCAWDYASELTWKKRREEMGREALREDVLRWNCAKPKGCRCPEAMLLNWDLAQADWWDIWDKTA